MFEYGPFIIAVHRRWMRDIHRRATDALQQLSDADVNWRPNEESNSIANLVIHLAGNLRQRLVAGIGGAPDTRDRDAEFNARAFYSRDQLVAILDESIRQADGVLAQLEPERLGETQHIRTHKVTALDVIFSVVIHLSEHVGQILYIAKIRKGSAYRAVSFPHRPGPPDPAATS